MEAFCRLSICMDHRRTDRYVDNIEKLAHAGYAA